MTRGVALGILAASGLAAAGPAVAQPGADISRVTAILPAFEVLADRAIRTTAVPGMAIAVVYRDQVVYLKGFGVRKAGEPAPVDADTVFQLASCTKPLTGTALATLVGAGRLGWDDRVIDHDPGFRLYDPWVTREVTVRDLLTHRTGLPAFAGDDLENLGYDRRGILDRVRFLPPASSFRSLHAYTNYLFTEAGEIGARVAGTSFADFVAAAVFRPLGMSSSSARFADYESATNRAWSHVLDNGRMLPKFVRHPDGQAPAGGVSSSARDLARWLRLQLGQGSVEGRQLIPAAVIAETHAPQIVTGFNPATFSPTGFYGLGWVVTYDERGRKFVHHSGAFAAGVRSEIALLPAERVGIAILTNGFPSGLPEAMSRAFFTLFLTGNAGFDVLAAENARIMAAIAALVPPPRTRTRPQPVTPARPAATYLGRYLNDYFGPLEVVEREGRLSLLLPPRRLLRPLTHWDRDAFTVDLPDEAGDVQSDVHFTLGSEGQAIRIRIEQLDGHGLGTFERVP
jgi:CubicO group peptidase (beta-lactamase class C family)